MSDRILDFSEEPVRLHVEGELLVVELERGKTTVPFTEIAVLVSSHPRVSFTQSVLSKLAQAGAVMVTCDEKRMPAAMLLPLEAHFIQGERFEKQAAASIPTRKRLWQSIVKAKVSAQARLLTKLYGKDNGLFSLANDVRSGDPENIEGQAARRYWPLLFADSAFRRERMGDDQNRFLNYGYAVLRASTARAVCAAGLHPSLGLNHHNRYDAFRLADDLMEPYRTLVDEAVVALVAKRGPKAPLDKETKPILLKAIMGKIIVEKESRSLFDALFRMASSLTGIFLGERESLSCLDWE